MLGTSAVITGLVAILSVPPTPWPSSRDAAVAYLATLDAATTERAVLSWDHPARLRWYPSPGPRRPGLYVSEMTPAQRVAMHELLRSVLSTQGYLSVALVMLNQDLIAKKYPGEDESSGRYSLAIYGDPSKDDLWSWRLGGHHVSLHFSYRGARLLSATPLFLGIDTLTDRDSPARDGLRVLARRHELGRSLVDSLGASAEGARLGAPPGKCMIRDGAGMERAQTEGVAAPSLPEAARQRLARLALEYFRDLDPGLAAPHEAALEARFAELRVAWSGSTGPGEELYYRIRGRDFALELYFRDGHVHSIWRRSDDFGKGR